VSNILLLCFYVLNVAFSVLLLAYFVEIVGDGTFKQMSHSYLPLPVRVFFPVGNVSIKKIQNMETKIPYLWETWEQIEIAESPCYYSVASLQVFLAEKLQLSDRTLIFITHGAPVYFAYDFVCNFNCNNNDNHDHIWHSSKSLRFKPAVSQSEWTDKTQKLSSIQIYLYGKSTLQR